MAITAPAVSVKAALRLGGRWVVLKNERDEWELPGGQVAQHDGSLPDTLRRECREELGIEVTVGHLIDSWLFEVVPGKRVVIVCFLAEAPHGANLSVSDEHTEVATVSLDELRELDDTVLPVGYRRALQKAAVTAG